MTTLGPIKNYRKCEAIGKQLPLSIVIHRRSSAR